MTTDPKRTGVKIVPTEFSDEDYGRASFNPGAAMLSGDRLMFGCPGCGSLGGVRIGNPKPADKPSWEIVSGSLSDLTSLSLLPSIHCVGCCGWHGYLTNGVFISC